MFSLKSRFTRLSASLVLTTALTLGAALPAFADTITGTSAVTLGDLAITGTSAANFGSIEIDGTNQDPTAVDATIDVKDDTGSGAGWKVTFAASQFTSVEGKTLATNALSITGVDEDDSGSGTYTAPTNSVSYTSAVVPGAGTVTLFNAAANSGMGHFQLNPAFKVHIPANAYAGTYTSTFTVTVASGPA